MLCMEEDESVGQGAEPESGPHAEEAFIAEMRRRRALMELSQGDLATRASALGDNLYQQTIAKLEAGQRALKLSEADAIARALGTTVQEMLSVANKDAQLSAQSDSRNMEALEAEVAQTLVELQQATAHAAFAEERVATSAEMARQAGAEMREASHAHAAAQERVRLLQTRYAAIAAQLAKWRAVEEETGKRHRPQKRGSGFVPVED